MRSFLSSLVGKALFKPSSIDTRNIFIDGFGAHIGNGAFNLFDSAGHFFRRPVFRHFGLDIGAQLGAALNLHALIFGVLSCDIRFVIRFRRIV